MTIEEKKEIYPILPLRNTVLFPQQIFPVYIGREQSLNLIKSLPNKGKKYIFELCFEKVSALMNTGNGNRKSESD